MVRIDGSEGEGGGQVLRTALALSLVTGTPFTITNIRAGRKKPGLLRQHLTGVKAAEAVGAAEVSGAELGSRELTFRPRALAAGNYHFSVGTAGSATLVLQTVLPALLMAGGPSTLMLEGGTHNPAARRSTSSRRPTCRCCGGWGRRWRRRWTGRASSRREAGGSGWTCTPRR